jgi:hypothetical protein
VTFIYLVAGPEYSPHKCRFNLNKWLIISATNFYTAQALLVLLVVLVTYSREDLKKTIAYLTGLYFCVFIPFLSIYDLFGGFTINNSNVSPSAPCVRLA